MYNDTAYDEFMSRGWGAGSVNDDVSKRARNTQQMTSVKNSLELKGIEKPPTPETPKLTKQPITKISKSEGLDFAGAGIEVMGQAHNAYALMENFKGGQFDTSAEGGGVGKAGPAILQGAQQGGELGGAIGSVAGPTGKIVGTAVGAVAGGLNSVFSHRKAKNEYVENRKDLNVTEDALQRQKSQETYRTEQGLASLADLKSLREKQLGIIS